MHLSPLPIGFIPSSGFDPYPRSESCTFVFEWRFLIASGVRREHGFARDPDASCIGTSLGAQEEIPLYFQSSVASKLFLTGGCAGDGRCRRERRRLPRLRASRGRRGTPGRVWRRRGARRAALEGRNC